MENIQFKVIAPRGGRRSSPTITIRPSGAFSLNTGFFDKYAPDRPTYAIITHGEDQAAHYVGFILTNNAKQEGTLKCYYPRKNKGLAVIQSISFFKKTGISAERYSGKYDISVHNDRDLGKLYVIKLKK